MPVQVLMPQLGESVIEGTLTRWIKTVGERVNENEPLVEVNTDKVDTEIPSPASGVVLKTLVAEGTTVRAGTLLAWIGQPGEEIPEEAAVASTAASGGAVQISSPPAQRQERELGFISPVVARIASEHHLDLTQIQGSGQGGRITKKDVLAYLEAQQTRLPSVSPGETPPTVAAEPTPEAVALPGEIIPLSAVRRAVAEHMVLSKRTSPHVTTVMEADLSNVVAHRQANQAAMEREGVHLTYTAYFFAAAVAALKAYPILNSSWSEEGIRLHRQINIGMATSLGEAGLIVPVIKNADSLSLLGLARVINDLAGRARLRKLQPDEVQGGTFTITNHGTSGSLFATPIIHQPQCAILGVGAVQKRVVVISDPQLGDSIAIRPRAYLSLTFDHRIIDGAIADAFLGKVVAALEHWS